MTDDGPTLKKNGKRRLTSDIDCVTEGVGHDRGKKTLGGGGCTRIAWLRVVLSVIELSPDDGFLPPVVQCFHLYSYEGKISVVMLSRPRLRRP